MFSAQNAGELDWVIGFGSPDGEIFFLFLGIFSHSLPDNVVYLHTCKSANWKNI